MALIRLQDTAQAHIYAHTDTQTERGSKAGCWIAVSLQSHKRALTSPSSVSKIVFVKLSELARSAGRIGPAPHKNVTPVQKRHLASRARTQRRATHLRAHGPCRGASRCGRACRCALGDRGAVKGRQLGQERGLRQQAPSQSSPRIFHENPHCQRYTQTPLSECKQYGRQSRVTRRNCDRCRAKTGKLSLKR